MTITGFDPARNFAIADLASGITNVATSITLATGKGALFPDPSADGAFNVPLYNSTDYTAPWLDPDVEIVRVTARSTDTLTVTRAQEGTSAVAHNTGGKTYSLYMTFSRKAYDDLVTAINTKPTESLVIACSDESTALTTGTAKVTFRMPYAFTLSAVRASVTTAPTGASLLTVDINESGTTILSTKITIDASEKTSTTAATPPVISDTALADDAEMTIDIDQVGSTIAGAGLKVYLIGKRT